MKNTRHLVFIALSVALALAISLVEQMIPLPFIAPGARLGLSNIIILTSLVVFGFRDAFTVAVLKSVLLMLVTGQVSSMFYSLAGSVLSVTAMFLALRYGSNFLSMIGVSIIGACAHNIGQFIVAALVLQGTEVFLYLPVIFLLGLFTGIFVGLASDRVSGQLLKLVNRI